MTLKRSTRRDFLKRGGISLAGGCFGMSFLQGLFMKEAYGLAPAANKLYDAVIQVFYSGGPSQTDTWDPKPGSTSNVFNTINLGVNDIYGQPLRISDVFPNLANLVANDGAVGLGVVRSMTHRNNSHASAQSWMNCFWQSTVAARYPSTAAVMAHLHEDQVPLKIPSVVIGGSNGRQVNDGKGANIALAFGANQNGSTARDLRRPSGVDGARYARRKTLVEAFNKDFAPTRPDVSVKAWERALQQAYDVTVDGQAAAAFDLTGKTILPGGPNANGSNLRRLTMAQELVKAGIPYVACGIGGNDSHSNNTAVIRRNWGDTTDVPLAKMAENLKAAGKRVLILMGGEFGRTPASVAPKADGTRRDGRDHWGDGFSWAMLSVNQPAFKTTGVGDTGPDGLFRDRDGKLVDPVKPGALGTLVYRAMGYPVGTGAQWDVPIVGGTGSPVDETIANATTPGGGAWLMKQFGLA